MYKMTENQLDMSGDFFLPFGGKLNKENRWVILANFIPWWQFEEAYADTMGAFISYLQYFVGLPEFQEKAPFDSSMMTHFRKRLDADIINQLNEAIVMEELKAQNQDEGDDSDDNDESPSGNTSSEDTNE